jgi:nitric oxide reductase subunit B
MLDTWAREEGASGFDTLADNEMKSALRARLERELRENTYDIATGDVVISPIRRRAIEAVAKHYVGLFGDDESLAGLRESYAMPRQTVSTPARAHHLTAFFFWATWACVTERPDSNVTYTNNWPPEELVGNRPTGTIVVVSVASFVLLLGGIGSLVWYYAATHRRWEEENTAPLKDPLLGFSVRR